MSENNSLRPDLALIAGWITAGAKVLDLGCGDGALLANLAQARDVTGYGLEIDPNNVVKCVARGVDVLQMNLDEGLAQFEDGSFDFVVMSSALQQVRRPDLLVDEMLRIGRESIVTFPNLGHWRPRVSLGLKGLMPMSKALPAGWYDTPNIHLCTVQDFEVLCRQKQVRIKRRHLVNHAHRSSLGARLLPNLLGEIALYQLYQGD